MALRVYMMACMQEECGMGANIYIRGIVGLRRCCHLVIGRCKSGDTDIPGIV
jgi:hypothetical protein